jgi:hypothetical protein
MNYSSSQEISRYKLELGSVQKVRWDKEGTVRAEDHKMFLLKRKEKLSLVNRIFCTPQNNISS